MTGKLLVTGAAGHLGRRVIETLLDLDAGPIIATTRNPAALSDLSAHGVDVRAADFDRPDDLARAFWGAGRMLLISTDAVYEPGQRLRQHRAAIAAAEAAGVRHIVYTSVPAPQPRADSPVEDDHFWTEQAIAASSMSWTFMRHALYQELLLFSLPRAIASGTLETATGDRRIHWVSRDDCARADAAVLASSDYRNRIYEITGPAAISARELAIIASEFAGTRIVHSAVEIQQLRATLEAAGMPAPAAAMVARFDEIAAAGFYGTVTPHVEHLTKRRPRSVTEFLRANAAVLHG